ncbi:adenosine receptor A3-like [Chanos chanos]|uniref:Adenosine receptor A3-like n=1 Tax=Chanos chanos TaxID=29144 RepID=A0A6J2UW73_CHACN|nr:adenosine receptor A3-like [Chanos chanos]
MERNQSSFITFQQHQVLRISFMLLLAIAITFGNMMSLIVFLGSRRFYTSQGYLKASLAFADLAVGVLVVPYSVYTEIGRLLTTGDEDFGSSSTPGRLSTKRESFKPCFIMGTIFAACTLVSVTTIFLLSVERSITVLKPLHKNVVVTKGRTLGLIILTWLVCFFLAVTPLLLSPDITLEYSACSKMCTYALSPTGQQHQQHSFSGGANIMLIFPVFDLSLLTGTCIVNGVTFSAVRRFCQARSQALDLTPHVSGGPSFSDIRAAKTIIIITVFFCASFLPVAVFVMGSVSGHEWCEFSFYAFWILTCSSCWNVAVYSVCDRRFGYATRELLFGRGLRRRHRPPAGMEEYRTEHCATVSKSMVRPERPELTIASYQTENTTKTDGTGAHYL